MTFMARQDAQGWLVTQQAAILEGRWSRPGQGDGSQDEAASRLGDYIEGWIRTRTSPTGAPLRPRTSEEYRRLATGPLLPLADIPVRSLTTRRVRAWHSELTQRGTITTAARAYGLLRAVYGTAVVDGIVSSNPVSIRGAQSGHTGKRVEPPTADELAVIVSSIATRHRAAVLVAAWGGLRFGELTELRRKDIEKLPSATGDLTVLRVRRAVSRTAAGFIVGPPKSAAGIRDVVLPAAVAEELDAHLTAFVPPGADALVFAARTGLHLAESTLAKSFYKARALAARPDLPWHGLRHFAGVSATRAGLPLRDVQARLGHSTVSAAMRYQHAVIGHAEISAALERAMS